MTKNIPKYCLENKNQIGSENSLEVKHPKDWIDSSDGPSGK